MSAELLDREPRCLEDVLELVPEAESARVSTGFQTRQGVRHASRATSYRNHVLSLRVEDAVGSCSVEPGALTDADVLECVGAPVRQLVGHPNTAVRIAALDAYLMWRHPHRRSAEELHIGRGNSLVKSVERAKSVVSLLPRKSGRVLVIGVVNSLLQQLRQRGDAYVPCDHKGGTTEWDEPIHTEALPLLDGCDAILASGMVLATTTFAPLLDHARCTGKPLVLFAQTGSAILPWFLGSGVTAVSAEPYPFCWLDGGPSVLHRYRVR